MPKFYDDICEQPQAIQRTIKALESSLTALQPYADQLRKRTLERVILTGMGGSYAAATLCQLMLIKAGITALVVETAELIYDYRAFFTPQTLIIAISQSGQSVEIVRLLDIVEWLKERPAVIGITNTEQSSLGQRSTSALLIQAGEEQSVASKTYTCTLTALVGLGTLLTDAPLKPCFDGLNRAADKIESNLANWSQRAQHIAGQIGKSAQFMVYLGRSVSRASALAGALLTKETAKLPAEGMIGGQFRHGPVEVLTPEVAVAVFMGSGHVRELNIALLNDLEARNANVIPIGNEVSGPLSIEVPTLDDWLMPLVEIVPIQLLAGELAATRGIVPGEFRHGTKVTTVE